MNKRRKFLSWSIGSFVVGLGGLWLGRRAIIERLMRGNFDTRLLTAGPALPTDTCVLTSAQSEGPFYVPSPERRDIREGRAGVAMALRMQIQGHPDCAPLAGAVVEIWQCDAEGEYSGYPREIAQDMWNTIVFVAWNGKKTESGGYRVDPVTESRFLRGLQRTDADGWVEFLTIVPGWYVGRAPHIHVRVALNEKEQLTTQLYLEKQLTDRIYATAQPYSKLGPAHTGNAEDMVLSRAETTNGLLVRVNQAAGDGPLLAETRIGVKRSA